MAKRILTVDDSKTMRDMVSFTLKKAGYDVGEAEDGKAALTVLGGSQFDLIITDLNMPNMDGISLIRNVRAGSQHRAVPSCLMTKATVPRKPTARRQAPPGGWSSRSALAHRAGAACMSMTTEAEAIHSHSFARLFRNAPAA